MGKEFTMDKKYVRCMECGSEGDFFDENEETTEKVLSKLKEEYVNEVLDFFNEKKISFAGIERAVGLPQRTLTKWKNGISTPTAAGIALLKYLRTFPWLVDVAENKFDYDISQKIFMKVAFNTFVNSVQFINGGEVVPEKTAVYQ
jgi:DNA-binding transcriptional regulator YiaG